MAGQTTTTVFEDENGYYNVRVPKALGDALDLGGSEVSWTVTSSNSLRVTKE